MPIVGRIKRNIKKRGFSRNQYLFLAFLTLIIIILQVVRVYVINYIGPQNIALAQIQEDIQDEKFEGQVIRAEILGAMSLTEINERAKKQGFIDCPSCEYLIKK